MYANPFWLLSYSLDDISKFDATEYQRHRTRFLRELALSPRGEFELQGRTYQRDAVTPFLDSLDDPPARRFHWIIYHDPRLCAFLMEFPGSAWTGTPDDNEASTWNDTEFQSRIGTVFEREFRTRLAQALREGSVAGVENLNGTLPPGVNPDLCYAEARGWVENTVLVQLRAIERDLDGGRVAADNLRRERNRAIHLVQPELLNALPSCFGDLRNDIGETLQRVAWSVRQVSRSARLTLPLLEHASALVTCGAVASSVSVAAEEARISSLSEPPTSPADDLAEILDETPELTCDQPTVEDTSPTAPEAHGREVPAGRSTEAATEHSEARHDHRVAHKARRLPGAIWGVAAVALLVLAIRMMYSAGVFPAKINVQSSPEGARIVLDGVDTGQVTPWVFERVAPGNHTVTLGKEDHMDGSADVVAAFGTSRVVNLTLVPTKGTLAVESTPEGAQVFINGKVVSAKTPASLSLPAGDYTVLVRLKGYQDYTTRVSVTNGATSYCPKVLEKTPTYGTLAVTSSPAGASIWIAANDSGYKTPHTFSLETGTYAIALRRSGYDDWTNDNAVVREGVRTAVAGTLTRTPVASPRPANGAILRRLSSSKGGLGELSINIDTGTDAILKLVRSGESKASVVVYIRSNSTARVTGIRDGVYRVIYARGRDYYAQQATFLSDLSCKEFDESLTYTTTSTTYWTYSLKLYGVIGGNASTSPVSDGSFGDY